ncbi:MAG: cysteine desulfurase family protein [Kiritimatiellia bacterium]
MIYLDNNATTAIAPEVVASMEPYFTTAYFNPSSAYDASRGPSSAIAAARTTVAHFLGGVHPDEIIFTGCATESNNAAIFGTIRAQSERRHIITTAVEHPSVLEVCKEARREGCEVSFIGVNRRGELDEDAFVKALRPDTLLVSLMHGNNETGVIFPIAALARVVKETNPAILFHTDATQTAGKLALDLCGDLQHVDLLSFSGHKLHGPKGVGALFVRRGARIRPFLCGGHQEGGRRAGTENVAYIVALAKACELATAAMADEGGMRDLRDHLEARLCAAIPWLEVNGAGAERLPNTLNLACHCIEGESMLYQLDAAGICASSGSACTSGSLEPSHVLKAMDIPFMAMHGSIRFSLSRYTTREEIDAVIAQFPGIVDRLRRLSPYWDASRQAPRGAA